MGSKKKTSFATKLPSSGKAKGKGGNGIFKVILLILAVFVVSIILSHLVPPTGSSDTPAQHFAADTLKANTTDSLTLNPKQ